MRLGWAAPPSSRNEPLLLRHSATGTPAAGVDAGADGDDYFQRGRQCRGEDAHEHDDGHVRVLVCVLCAFVCVFVCSSFSLLAEPQSVA